MIKISVIFAFALILLFSLASPVLSSSYSLELNQVDDKILAEYYILLDKEDIILLVLPSDASSISSSVNYSLDGGVLAATGDEIRLSYITKSFLEKSDEGYYFVEDIKFDFPVDNASITIILKEGYFLDSEHIFPKPYEIKTDGRQISVLWRLNNVKQGDSMPIFLAIKTSEQFYNFWIWLITIALIVGVYFAYRHYHKKEKKTDVDKYLMESEKAILNELKTADRGELWQKQLQLKTNFSKAKLSRLIRNLEQRNLVEKIPFGNTNKVRLR